MIVSLSLSYLSACNNAACNAMPRLSKKKTIMPCWLQCPSRLLAGGATPGMRALLTYRGRAGSQGLLGPNGHACAGPGLDWGPGHQDPRPRGQAPPEARGSLAGYTARGLLPRAASATANPKGGHTHVHARGRTATRRDAIAGPPGGAQETSTLRNSRAQRRICRAPKRAAAMPQPRAPSVQLQHPIPMCTPAAARPHGGML